MNNHSNIKTISHSFIFKTFIIITLLALSIIAIISFFREAILSDEHTHLIVFLFVIIIIFFSLAGYFIHRLLIPIYELKRGVKEISKGNLNVSINVKSKDELGDLAKAFNQMTTDLQGMIKAREQLLLDVSHELRTPITRAKIALEMMAESEYSKSVQNDLKEMETMIKELLETEKLKNGFKELDFEAINIKQFIANTIEGYKDEIHRIKTNIISEHLSLKADSKLLQTAIKNIIDNSLKYSPIESQAIEISVIDKQEKIHIQIEDFGSGIPENKLPFIFEPFYRVDNSRSKKTGGYGLGLHLCKRIIEAHKGKISIKNKADSEGIVVLVEMDKTF